MRIHEQTLIVEIMMPARQQNRFQGLLLGEDGLAVVRCLDPEKKKLQLWTSAVQKEVLYHWLDELPDSLQVQILDEWVWDG
ncbi:MAG: DUF4911 domain-containing protein [Mariprofundus sp.]|nr:DUF4911 domain-containing protein [Mariprofundus sp.]